MTEYFVRFLAGGIVVSAFAMLGDILKPKSFAGLFGAAPSVALATLGIAIYQHGASYAASQSLSMMAGAIALAVYSVVVCHLLIRARMRALPATMASSVACAGLTRRSILPDTEIRPDSMPASVSSRWPRAASTIGVVVGC
jgi:Protein of unknown function (DUF3147)